MDAKSETINEIAMILEVLKYSIGIFGRRPNWEGLGVAAGTNWGVGSSNTGWRGAIIAGGRGDSWGWWWGGWTLIIRLVEVSRSNGREEEERKEGLGLVREVGKVGCEAAVIIAFQILQSEVENGAHYLVKLI